MKSLNKILLLSLFVLFAVGSALLIKNYPSSPKKITEKKLPYRLKKLEYTEAFVLPQVKNGSDLNTLLKTEPTAAGSIDLVNLVSTITKEAIKSTKSSNEYPLPLLAHWNTGDINTNEGMTPSYIITLIENGYHILPGWRLNPYWQQQLPDEYYKDSILRAKELNLPLTFIINPMENTLTNESYYFGLPTENNPNALDINSNILNKLSPLGPDELWSEIGQNFSNTQLLKKIQEWYPNPPLIMFVDNSTPNRLSWLDIGNSSRFVNRYGNSTDDNFKRIVISAHWIEKYRLLHEALRENLTSKTWKTNTRFVSYNPISLDIGNTNDWMNKATITNREFSFYPLTTDAISVRYFADNSSESINDAIFKLNNLPFVLQQAHKQNSSFSCQLSINNSSYLDTLDKYKGFAQLALWLARPNVIRKLDSDTNDKDTIMSRYKALLDSVELIYSDETLQYFWKYGKLVANKNKKTQETSNVPHYFTTSDRWFLLDVDINPQGTWNKDENIPVFAIALQIGTKPNRKWLVLAQSFDGDHESISITIPKYKNITVDSSIKGNFYLIGENTSDQITPLEQMPPVHNENVTQETIEQTTNEETQTTTEQTTSIQSSIQQSSSISSSTESTMQTSTPVDEKIIQTQVTAEQTTEEETQTTTEQTTSIQSSTQQSYSISSSIESTIQTSTPTDEKIVQVQETAEQTTKEETQTTESTITMQTIDFSNINLGSKNGIKSAINKLIESNTIKEKEFKNYEDTSTPNYGKELYVSPNGKDSNPGTIDKPFATLEKARNAIRTYRKTNPLPNNGIVIWIREGTYSLEKPFVLYKQDSGEKDKPIVYRSFNNEKVRLVGGIKLNPNWFKPATSQDPVWNRLNSTAREHIEVLDLKLHGINNLGKLDRNYYASISPLELFDTNKALTLARWPDKGHTTYLPSLSDQKIHIYGNLKPDVTGTYIKQNSTSPLYKRDGTVNGKQYFIKRIEGKDINVRRSWILIDNNSKVLWSYDGSGYSLPKEFTTPHNNSEGVPSLIKSNDEQFGFAFTKEGLNDTSFIYSGDSPSQWKNTKNIWINGMLKYAWRNDHRKIKSIDSSNKIIHLTSTPTYGIKKGKYKKAYYAYNILEELTVPGEYYIDPSTYKLYVWPEKNIENTNYVVSTNNNSIISLSNASWIEFNGLTMEISRKNICTISGGTHNLITNSKLRFSGKALLSISGKDNGIQYSDLTGAGEEAINLSGGERSSLTPANNFVIDNEIHHNNRWNWTYKGAVRIYGVGNIVKHNNIHDLMHQAIGFNGNNHTIEYNNIYNVAFYAEDASVIYSGRHWDWRGNKINYNFIHDIKNNYGGSFICGIYFDDSLSGNEVVGNIFYNIDGRAIFVNGGRDNTIENNLFYNVATVYSGTNYGVKYINNKKDDSFNLLEKLKDDNVSYKLNPWSSSYPRLAAIPNNWEQVKAGKWLYPEGNNFQNNIGANYLKWCLGPNKNNFKYYTHFYNKPIKGNDLEFKEIPFGKIGIEIR